MDVQHLSTSSMHLRLWQVDPGASFMPVTATGFLAYCTQNLVLSLERRMLELPPSSRAGRILVSFST